MTHTARGEPKIVDECTLPLTSQRRVNLIVTELAVIEPTPAGLILKELAPAVSIRTVQQFTATQLIIPKHVPVMRQV